MIEHLDETLTVTTNPDYGGLGSNGNEGVTLHSGTICEHSNLALNNPIEINW